MVRPDRCFKLCFGEFHISPAIKTDSRKQKTIIYCIKNSYKRTPYCLQAHLQTKSHRGFESPASPNRTITGETSDDYRTIIIQLLEHNVPLDLYPACSAISNHTNPLDPGQRFLFEQNHVAQLGKLRVSRHPPGHRHPLNLQLLLYRTQKYSKLLHLKSLSYRGLPVCPIS